ncbi:TATA box-binding protein-associated factor RNA polymerase I subunit B isoform X2 [Salminus brasiliensis]|uniref:TATA box-binding protein-associated factor RNA polymerase I subunit B isoform X2 n=1 Tax=Salminus brasiliensis TaxID=930266 RepID=UPI003B83A276
MDEELTEGYDEPCAQCGAVCWALSDGLQFFCKNCHNVIERTQAVVDVSTFILNNKISSISSGSRKKTGREGGREWMICEGFQIVLKHQAEALVGLGVCPQFKTDVLWDFWKRYLQNTRQAYTRAPVSSSTNPVDLTSESEADFLFLSEQSDQSEPISASGYVSSTGHSSDGKSSVCSGSLDAECYFRPKNRKSLHLMNMPRTLALCHLALLWLREAITLADLLRLVSKRLVPYITVYEEFPEEMKFFGRDAMIFRVETIPSYRKVHREALQMAEVLQLPAFPSVTSDCLLHPALLSLRYLMDANLPDELHLLVRKVIEKTAMEKDFFLTFNPSVRKSTLLCYDLQAAALIIVTMKLLFRLDDHVEWKLSRKANEKGNGQGKKKMTKQDSSMFSLRTWYMIVNPALERARKREELFEARRQWKPKKLIIPAMKHRTVVLKRRRVVEQLQSSFRTLSGSVPEQQQPSSTSNFQFLWGQEEDADGPSLHHKRLSYVLEKRGKDKRLVNQKYWHTDLRRCRERGSSCQLRGKTGLEVL